MPALPLESAPDSKSLATYPKLKLVRPDGVAEGNALEHPVPAPSLFWPLAMCVLGISALWLDAAVLENLDSFKLRGDVARLVNYSEVFGHGVGACLFCLLAGLLDPRGLRVLGYLLTHALGAGLVADVFKLFFVRVRPHHIDQVTDGLGAIWPHLQSPSAAVFEQQIRSFPSGHAAVAAGLAIGLSRLYPRGTYLFALFAGLAALQRVTSSAHYPSDCLIGIAAAFALGYCLYHWPLRLHDRMLRA